jgi:hypothetical protein
MSLNIGKESSRQSTISLMAGKSEIRFGRIGDIGHPLYSSSNSPPATLLVKFPDAPLVRLRLEPRPEAATNTSSTFSSVVEMLTPTSLGSRHQALQLAAVEIGEEQFAVAARLNGQVAAPVDDGSAAMNPPVPSATVPAKVDASQTSAPTPASTASSPPATAATSAAPVKSPENPAHPASRQLSFPPIPVLSVPRLVAPQMTDSNAGPDIPDPRAQPEGPRFE